MLPSIRARCGRSPFLVLAIVCGLLADAVAAESSTFTRPSAETFTGKQALEDAFRRLELDYRSARATLDLLGIGQNSLVTYWQWSAPDDTAPPSIEFHIESGEYVVIDIAAGTVLTYLRYGEYWISPGTPEASAPEIAKQKTDAMAEEKASALAMEWLAKFAPDATWIVDPPEYKDRFDVTPADLYGAWWDFTFERTHKGYTVRGADAEISINAETGQLMRFAMPIFTPPANTDVYFPLENARIKADDYLNIADNTLEGLMVFKPSLPEQQIQDTGDNFSVRGGLGGNRAQRKEIKKASKQAKNNKNRDSGAAEEFVVPTAAPVPPTLASGEAPLVLAPVSECWKQQTWQPIDPTKPATKQYLLVYEFPTQTPTAPTLPVLITANGNEVVR